jgi:hypothetical protein
MEATDDSYGLELCLYDVVLPDGYRSWIASQYDLAAVPCTGLGYARCRLVVR